MNDGSKKSRRRRSSSLLYQEPQESIEHLSDQSAIPNLNANWVNAKGAWVIHIVLIVALKIFFSIIPGIQRDTSWILTNITYMFGSYLMFHWVRGIPFEFNAGAYDNLNMWEQMDNGEQFTPTKKFLLSVPICLFLVSTHYTHYDLTYFTLNVMALLGVIIPKLPWSHRLREATSSTTDLSEEDLSHVKIMLYFFYNRNYDLNTMLPPVPDSKDQKIKHLETHIAVYILGDKYTFPSLSAHAARGFANVLRSNRESFHSDVLLSSVPLVYGNTLANIRTLRTIIMREVTWWFNVTSNLTQEDNESLLEITRGYQQFREDLILFYARNFEESTDGDDELPPSP
ncbi:MAG: hypothetical protein Q9213_004193 [Squamulea squamosa]